MPGKITTEEQGVPKLHSEILRTAVDFNLNELGRILLRRRLIILGTIAAVLLLTTVWVMQTVPMYTASVHVMLQPRESRVVDVEAVLSGLPTDIAGMQSEIQVLKSRRLVQRTVEQLGLTEIEEFNGRLRPKSAWKVYLNPKTYIPDFVLELFRGETKTVEITDDERAARERAGVVDNFLRNLTVSPEGRSLVIQISFTSEDPRLAADIVNAHADFYIVSQLEAKFEATKRATKWLSERLTDLRDEVVVAEGAVEGYRKNAGLIKGQSADLTAEEVSELNTLLVQARTRRADAEARLRQMRKLMNTDEGIESATEVLSSGLIQKLREQEAGVERRAAELAMEYGERHPKMINIRAEIADLRAKIRSEVGKIIQGVRNEVAVEKNREDVLKANVRNLKTEVSRLNEAEVSMRALEREATATRTLFETFLVRYKETSAQEDFQQPDATIISMADIPRSPSYPNSKMVLIMAFIGSVFLGLLLAFGVELLDLGFRSMEQIEQIMGMAPLGLVPALKSSDNADTYVLENPASAYSEAIRSLHTSLLLSDVDRPPKVVLVTSSLPSEGKSTVCLSLAHLLAGVGQKVVVVDCDLRRPSMHVSFGAPSRPGLVEFLAGKSTLEEVINKDQNSRAHLIPAGSPAPNPPDLLSSGHMRRLLKGLSDAYDLVILDSAPVIAISDTRVLGRLVDKTVFVTRWAHTRREVAMSALRHLADSGTDVAGVLLSRVDVKKHAQYGYGDSGYYHGRVKKYYTS
jgi:polysaccharide biosynthesis transport protein